MLPRLYLTTRRTTRCGLPRKGQRTRTTRMASHQACGTRWEAALSGRTWQTSTLKSRSRPLTPSASRWTPQQHQMCGEGRMSWATGRCGLRCKAGRCTKRRSATPRNASSLTPPQRKCSLARALPSQRKRQRSWRRTWKQRRRQRRRRQRRWQRRRGWMMASRRRPPCFMGRRHATTRGGRGWMGRRISSLPLTSHTFRKRVCTRGQATPRVSTLSGGFRSQGTCCSRPRWTARSRSGTSTTTASARAPTWGTRSLCATYASRRTGGSSPPSPSTKLSGIGTLRLDNAFRAGSRRASRTASTSTLAMTISLSGHRTRTCCSGTRASKPTTPLSRSTFSISVQSTPSPSSTTSAVW
mmetsp:Transcript_68404/g.142626  ORF Transcript_68404/g.142626 Transcript_68404/m.142626 type:complete len:355 (+) Transcript_68404:228-1292(+)